MTAMDNEEPKCDRCGAPITTGAMAAICPRREKCEFWPDDEESQRFLDDLGMRLQPNAPHEGPGGFSPGPLDAVVGRQTEE